ncbi:hypothetical protein JXJ21_22095 [candidate division KSB1 bacterium]|nr:hypothetical protein [candidate division KSB1 bacterium]
MAKKLKISAIIASILGVISAGWLVYNVIAFELIKQKPTRVEAEELGVYVFIGLIVFFLFHLAAFLTIVFRFQHFKKISHWGILRLFTGVISFVSLIGDWAALTDIYRQQWNGLSSTLEWTFLYLALIPHTLFLALSFTLVYSIFRSLHRQPEEHPGLKDEIVFETAHYTGIFCSLIGLAFTVYALALEVSPRLMKYLIIPYGAFIIMPYGLICFYWLIIKRKERLTEWYDEKQWQDMTKAGLITLILSIPAMALFFIFNYFDSTAPWCVMWFPYYLFMIILIFSATVLYFYKTR